MRAFLDSSAFVKRYVEEAGSDDVQAVLGDAERLVVSVLCLPECVSAFRRLTREGRLSAGEYEMLRSLVLADLTDADICQLAPEVVDASLACLERHHLRTLDALHLGSALVVGPDVFVSADRRQIQAAAKEGLSVRLV